MRRRVGGGVASHKWWERPARQTEGTGAISIREGGGCLSVYARACERRVVRYARMMRGDDMVVVSIRNDMTPCDINTEVIVVLPEAGVIQKYATYTCLHVLEGNMDRRDREGERCAARRWCDRPTMARGG